MKLRRHCASAFRFSLGLVSWVEAVGWWALAFQAHLVLAGKLVQSLLAGMGIGAAQALGQAAPGLTDALVEKVYASTVLAAISTRVNLYGPRKTR